MKNAIVAQSGGPTAVINNSIRGLIDTLQASNRIGHIYGARMGILGVLREELLDISSQQPQQIALLEQTPSAGVLGSCRYKVRTREDLERIVEVLTKQEIGYFFYCGGNDSMDTAHKVHLLAQEKGVEIVCVGIAKTIDNDLGGPLQPDGTFSLCDHSPGYPSTARSTVLNILEANEENKASYTSDPVLVIGVMGRKIGFIPASARLADPERKMPLLLILPEAFNHRPPEENLSFITDAVNLRLQAFGRCIVVIGEGVNLGDLNVLRDSFGHEEFSASGCSVEQLLINHLNGLDQKDSRGWAHSRLSVPGVARCERPGTRQRREWAAVSLVDRQEAYGVGCYAAQIALKGESGFMATIRRLPGVDYRVVYDKVPLPEVANAERSFPATWLSSDRTDVTDEFIRWAAPLLGGELPVFAEFQPIFAPKRCAPYKV